MWQAIFVVFVIVSATVAVYAVIYSLLQDQIQSVEDLYQMGEPHSCLCRGMRQSMARFSFCSAALGMVAHATEHGESQALVQACTTRACVVPQAARQVCASLMQDQIQSVEDLYQMSESLACVLRHEPLRGDSGYGCACLSLSALQSACNAQAEQDRGGPQWSG